MEKEKGYSGSFHVLPRMFSQVGFFEELTNPSRRSGEGFQQNLDTRACISNSAQISQGQVFYLSSPATLCTALDLFDRRPIHPLVLSRLYLPCRQLTSLAFST
ncbi:hypothetical protein H5410_058623 [Solanum commersonii]|uniref:Uncharacterized protein n=1 Tax=Solanum commersonii TaxID=4109 RepID=A0A9J5WRM7_SOLCO|nr:hypothetical protein H5410_058623 [Solanum commersonii]